MKNIKIYKLGKNRKVGDLVGVTHGTPFFEIKRNKKGFHLEFSGITIGKKLCSCKYCTIGGIGSSGGLTKVSKDWRRCIGGKQGRAIEKDFKNERLLRCIQKGKKKLG